MAARRAKVVSLADLSSSIDKAVSLAAKRHGIKTEGDNVILDWDMVGRVLCKPHDLDRAMAAATTISKAVKVPGIVAEPKVTKVKGNVLIGFVVRGQLKEPGR
jgi:hypothetical protein